MPALAVGPAVPVPLPVAPITPVPLFMGKGAPPPAGAPVEKGIGAFVPCGPGDWGPSLGPLPPLPGQEGGGGQLHPPDPPEPLLDTEPVPVEPGLGGKTPGGAIGFTGLDPVPVDPGDGGNTPDGAIGYVGLDAVPVDPGEGGKTPGGITWGEPVPVDPGEGGKTPDGTIGYVGLDAVPVDPGEGGNTPGGASRLFETETGMISTLGCPLGCSVCGSTIASISMPAGASRASRLGTRTGKGRPESG